MAASALLSGCMKAGRPEQVRIASHLLENTLPVEVARQNRYFEACGLDAAVTIYDTGLAELEAVISGKEDAAVGVADYVFATKVLAGEDLRVIASIDENDFMFIIARKDRGILSPRDLAGKRVGVLEGTAQQFYLSRFLDINGLRTGEVTAVDVGVFSKGSGLLTSGAVDALITVDPYLSAAASALGDKAVVWPAQGSQPIFTLIVCRTPWVGGHEEAVVRLLRAVKMSQDFIVWHPSEARAIARDRLEMSAERVDVFWQRNEYALSLGDTLVAALEDETRWLMASGLTRVSAVPDFASFFHTAAMRRVHPDGVLRE